MIEDEIKLSIHGLFELPELVEAQAGVHRVEPAGTRALRATYWDTSDLRLARNGVSLRYRTGEDGPPWQLKLPVNGAGPGVREELAAPGSPGEVPETLRALLTAWVRTAVLTPVATLRTSRAVYRILDDQDGELAELVDDTVSVLEGRRVVARFREIEVERRQASEATMSWLRDRLVEAGAAADGFTPKVVRALGPLATAPSDLPSAPQVGRGASGGTVVAAALAAGVRRLAEHDAPVRRRAPDAVHQMRVACRRLRSDLRTFGPLVDPQWAGRLRSELSWLADALGAARDLEVLRERIRAAATSDPLAPLDLDAAERVDAILAGREERALARVEAALAERRYVELLERVVEAARHPMLTELAQRPAAQTLTPLVAEAWQALLDKGGRLSANAKDHVWHKARIRAKRARYAAEAATPALGRPAKRLASAASSLQDVLGEHQDAVVAADTLLEIAGQHPHDSALVLTCGRLAERERQAVRETRAQFPKAWRAAARPKLSRWLSG